MLGNSDESVTAPTPRQNDMRISSATEDPPADCRQKISAG